MIKVEGTEAKVISVLSKELGFNESEIKTILNYISKHREILDADEFYKEICEFPEIKQGICSYMIPNTKYYVNLKKLTIILAATICDYYVTRGFANATLAAMGTQLQAITVLKEENLCLVKEIIRSKNRQNTVDLLNEFKGECVNCEIKCRFNRSGACTIGSDKIQESLENLKDRNVLVKKGSFYHYQI